MSDGKKKEGPTEIRTRIAGFKVQNANHYIIGPKEKSLQVVYILIRYKFTICIANEKPRAEKESWDGKIEQQNAKKNKPTNQPKWPTVKRARGGGAGPALVDGDVTGRRGAAIGRR